MTAETTSSIRPNFFITDAVEGVNLAPANELNITSAQRKEMSEKAEAAYTAHLDKIASKYGASVYADYEVYYPAGLDLGDKDETGTLLGDLYEAANSFDWDPYMAPFEAISDANDEAGVDAREED